MTYRRTYRQYIEELKAEWVDREITYNGEPHKVVDVDYNGMLLIDLKARFTDTMAIDPCAVNERR